MIDIQRSENITVYFSCVCNSNVIVDRMGALKSENLISIDSLNCISLMIFESLITLILRLFSIVSHFAGGTSI